METEYFVSCYVLILNQYANQIAAPFAETGNTWSQL